MRRWALRALVYCAELGFAKYFLDFQLPVLEVMPFFHDSSSRSREMMLPLKFRHHLLTDPCRWGGNRAHLAMSLRQEKHGVMSQTGSRDHVVEVMTTFLKKFLRGLRRGNLSQVQNHPVVTEVTGECC